MYSLHPRLLQPRLGRSLEIAENSSKDMNIDVSTPRAAWINCDLVRGSLAVEDRLQCMCLLVNPVRFIALYTVDRLGRGLDGSVKRSLMVAAVVQGDMRRILITLSSRLVREPILRAFFRRVFDDIRVPIFLTHPWRVDLGVFVNSDALRKLFRV